MEDNKTSKMQGIAECERTRNNNIINEKEQESRRQKITIDIDLQKF